MMATRLIRIPNPYQIQLPFKSDIEPKSSPELTSRSPLFQGLEAGESNIYSKLDSNSGGTKTGLFLKANSKNCFSRTTSSATGPKDCSEAESTLFKDEKKIEVDQNRQIPSPKATFISGDEKSAELDQKLSTTLSKVKNEIELMRLPNELLNQIYNSLDIVSRLYMTSTCRLFFTYRDKAVEECVRKEIKEKIGNKLNYLSENLHLLDRKETRDRLILYFKLLERTYTPPIGKEKLAEVHFDEKTITVAIKLIMHHNEHKFIKSTILEGFANIPGKPNEICIQYYYRRIFYQMSDYYNVVINYENQGMGFDEEDVDTHPKLTKIPRSFFNGITNEDLIFYVSRKLRELDEKTKRNQQEKSGFCGLSMCILS
jgi:hypothetical protein